MGKSEKKILVIAVGLIVGYGVLYSMFVSPLWASREEALSAAEQKLDRLKKLTKGSADTWEVPTANATLDLEAAALKEMLAELQTLQVKDLGPYKLTAVGDRDPNTYFDRMRRDLVENVHKESSVKIVATIAGDLGFRDKATNDPVALNLIRLYAMQRFFEAAKTANVSEVTSVQYPDPAVLERPEGLEIEKLIQIPIVVRLRLTESALGPLLYHLAPNPRHKLGDRYFCIRSMQTVVKDEKSGVLEASLNLGALFTESQLEAQGIVVKEERSRLYRPFQQPFGGGGGTRH